MTDTVDACPDCGSVKFWTRQGRDPKQEGEGHYRCHECGACFDDPHTRPRQSPHGYSGLAAKLDDADPDDLVGGEA